MVIHWWGVLPFCLLLLCIAIAPLVPKVQALWQHLRVQLSVALGFGLPVAVWIWAIGGHDEVISSIVEYAHFITLLFSLYVVTAGIRVRGDIRATPLNNTIFLAIGAAVASVVGTTGAAMLLVRPLLSTNRERELKSHTFVFAILIVANAGGLLTPLGDPPLFLGLLRGVPFLWPMRLIGEWLFVNGMLLLTYFAIDRQCHAREDPKALARDDTEVTPITVEGKHHLVWLACIVAAAALLPSVDVVEILKGTAGIKDWLPLREAVMLAAVYGSWRTGRRARVAEGEFKWEPILEVASLFLGIFLTMVPALKWVASVAPQLPINAVTLFWMTGGLSSVLDNAPTYAVFFELAKGVGGENLVAGVNANYLAAISLGAVLCGAMTYIGNGPNFMVKSIAESGGVRMPTFGGYVLRWVLPYYLPVLVAMMLLFLVADWRAKLVGGGVAIGLVCAQVGRALRYPDPHRQKGS